MAQPSTLYRFRVDLSDVDRGVYETLDFRVAMHPSESLPYLLTRSLAFILNSSEDLEFSATGLADPEAPALKISNPSSGQTSLWIEIGNPSPKKLHKAAKASQLVKVYTYKDAQLILNEAQGENIHKSEHIQIFAIDPKFIEKISEGVQRETRWSLLNHDGAITITWGTNSASTELKVFALPGA